MQKQYLVEKNHYQLILNSIKEFILTEIESQLESDSESILNDINYQLEIKFPEEVLLIKNIYYLENCIRHIIISINDDYYVITNNEILKVCGIE